MIHFHLKVHLKKRYRKGEGKRNQRENIRRYLLRTCAQLAALEETEICLLWSWDGTATGKLSSKWLQAMQPPSPGNPRTTNHSSQQHPSSRLGATSTLLRQVCLASVQSERNRMPRKAVMEMSEEHRKRVLVLTEPATNWLDLSPLLYKGEDLLNNL